MKRQQMLLTVAMIALAAGCNTPTPRFDPFLGRTTVPPPATGHIVSPVPGTADPYYPPASTTPGATIQQNQGTPQTIPFTQGQSSTADSSADKLVSQPIETADESSPVVQAGFSSEIRIIEPDARHAPAGTNDEPGRFYADDDVIPIPSRSHATAGADDYGFARDYRWLQGELEFSRIDRRWKLRYIPIDGQTDDFGGSVLLPDSDDLAGMRPGEFVRVEGQIAAGQTDDAGFAPLYRYQRIQRL